MRTPEKPNTRTVRLTVAFLVLLALAVVGFRTVTLGDKGLPVGDSAWSVEILFEVAADEEGAVIYLPTPYDTRHARLYAQSINHEGLRLRRGKTDRKERDVVLKSPKAGSYIIDSTFKIYVSHLPLYDRARTGLSEQNRAAWLSASSGVAVNTASATAIVDRLAESKPEAERLIELLFNHVSSNIRIDPRASHDSETGLKRKRATALGATRVLLALLRTAHLPARLVTGVDLQSTAPRQLRHWAEVYDGARWLPLDPVNGYFSELPIHYVPLRKGDDPLVKTENASVKQTKLEVVSLPAREGRLTVETRSPADIFDLTRLSPQSREILSVLLLLPLGVLSTELFRQFAGVRTYGTFTPTLLALAVSQVYWVTAIIVLALVTVIGVAIRFAMPDLKLQRTPRLAIVFTLVAVSMSVVVSGISYFNPGVDDAVSLLPIVILTMLVDRIYTVYDERGVHSAMVRLFWTLIAAVVALVVLLQSHWGTWLVSYPEMHAVTLALIIMIGLYRGPQLKDLPSFFWLKEPSRILRNRKTDKGQSEQSGVSL